MSTPPLVPNSSSLESSRLQKDGFFQKRWLLWGLAFIVGIALLGIISVNVLNWFLEAQNYQSINMEGGSMLPTIHSGDTLWIDKKSYATHKPAYGDIVAVYDLTGSSYIYVKRIIALPGDVITVKKDGTVVLNGKTLSEPYIAGMNQRNPFKETTDLKIPAGYCFVMGDNRVASADSREWGAIPFSNVIGKVSVK